MGETDKEIIKNYLDSLGETIGLIRSKLEESEEPIDEVLTGMLGELSAEMKYTYKVLEPADEATCARIAREIRMMKAIEYLSEYSERITKEKIPEEEPAKQTYWMRRFLSFGNLFKGLHYFFDKLGQLSSGTPFSGIFSNLSKLFGWIEGVFKSRA